MTMQEFGHLLHYLRVCNLKTSDDLIGNLTAQFPAKCYRHYISCT
jgi:hypothetical protein